MSTTEQIRLIKLPLVREHTSMSKSGIYEATKSSGFPAPVKIGLRASAWVESEVLGWGAARIQQRNALARPFADGKADMSAVEVVNTRCTRVVSLEVV